MKEIITTLLQNELGKLIIVLPIAIIAKNLGGALASQEKFESKYLKKGLYKGINIYLIIGLLVLISSILSDIGVTLNGQFYGVVEALEIIIYGLIASYVYGTIKILAEVFNSKVVVTEEENDINE